LIWLTPSISFAVPFGSEVPVPPPRAFPLADRQTGNIGDNPSADGEIGTVQAESEKGHGNGKDRSGETADQHAQKRVKPRKDDRREHRIGTDADKGLLPDRHQSRETGQHIPVHGKHKQRKDAEQVLHHGAGGNGGKRIQHSQSRKGCDQT
jgi:hypothetical protein